MLDIALQKEVIRQTYLSLKVFLLKYGLSGLPSRSDSDSQVVAFYKDDSAVKVVRALGKERSKLYRTTNPHVREGRILYNRRHKKQRAAYDRALIANGKSWYQVNPGKGRDVWHRRRARLVGAYGEYSDEEFQALCEAYEGRCFYCDFLGKENLSEGLTSDHMLPIIKGGSDCIENVVPACKHHNKSKGALTMPEYLQRLVREEGGSRELAVFLTRSLYEPRQVYIKFLESIEEALHPSYLSLAPAAVG